MTPELYRRATELFDRIRELPEPEQPAALESACAHEPELFTQVMRLLDADREAGQGAFLERRALEDAARLISPEGAGLPAPGTVFGNYRLGPRIGAGGMGIVFEAEDLRLHRRVAVKILPQYFAAQQKDRIQRFEREARAASLLNHPHIVSIFDAAFDQGCYYIAMEYIEGLTLRALIDAESRTIGTKTILEILGQIASALSAAHEAGIVHRDIKPDNIMIRPDGFVKVLDFGLASIREATSSNPSDLRTRPGHLAGTIQYLSPEQVLGKPASPRSDLFSLGVVAYELATGVRPFAGPTDGVVFEAILNRNPEPPSAIRPSLGPDLDILILQALEKDPDLRFQTAGEVRSACKRLTRDSSRPSIPHPVGARTQKRSRRPVLLAAAAVTMLAGALWYAASRGASSGPLPVQFQQLTDAPGEQAWPGFSPDGRQFVFASAREGNLDIFLQRIGGSAVINLTRDCKDDDTQPALSPDGSLIAFRSERDGGGLFLMDATGENPRRIAPHGYLPAWSPDGKRIVYSTHSFNSPTQLPPPPSDLYVLDLESGSETKLSTGDAIQPAWSPHGYRIACFSISAGGRRDIFTIPAGEPGTPLAVTSDAPVDWNPVWDPSGAWLYFLSDRGGAMNVWRVPIDERSGRTQGPPEPVTVPAERVGALAISGDGKSLIYSRADRHITLARISFDPVRRIVFGDLQPLGDGNTVANFTFSPDGSKIVYDTISDTSENLWIMNADGSERRRLTADSFRNRGPVWSPKGDQILFYSDRFGHYDDWLIRPDGGDLRPLTNAPGLDLQSGVWSPDGNRIIGNRFGTMLELNPAVTQPLTSPSEVASARRFSGLQCNMWTDGPQGGEAICDYYQKEVMQGLESQIAVFEPVTGKVEVLPVMGRASYWAPLDPTDPHRFFIFERASECLIYDRRLKTETRLFSNYPNTLFDNALAPNRKQIYFSRTIRNADLWLARLSR